MVGQIRDFDAVDNSATLECSFDGLHEVDVDAALDDCLCGFATAYHAGIHACLGGFLTFDKCFLGLLAHVRLTRKDLVLGFVNLAPRGSGFARLAEPLDGAFRGDVATYLSEHGQQRPYEMQDGSDDIQLVVGMGLRDVHTSTERLSFVVDALGELKTGVAVQHDSDWHCGRA